MTFHSDNVTGVAPEILDALQRANHGTAPSYGADDWTKAVEARLAAIFETDLAALPVATGTAANVLGLSLLTPPYGAIYCHAEAHINVDECGAPELFTGGAKLVPLPGEGAKIAAADLERAITGAGDVHHVQPAAVSLSQATEAGTLYDRDELAAIAAVARRHGLHLHMDGARFANALVALGCSPAEASWKAGVEVLSFGATKNGALAAEAIVLFRPDLREELAFRRKRGGHLFSKMRFLSAQLDAYLADDLWLRNARHANAMAARLAAGLSDIPGVALSHPVQANEIFARMPEAMIQGLWAEGLQVHRWGPDDRCEIRLVTAFNTEAGAVDAFIAAARRLSGPAQAESA